MPALPQHQRVAVTHKCQGTSCGLLNVDADAQWTQLPADTRCPGSEPHPATCSLQTGLPIGAHGSPKTFMGPPLHLSFSDTSDVRSQCVSPFLLSSCLISTLPENSSSLFTARVKPPQIPLLDSTVLGTHLKNSPALYSLILSFPQARALRCWGEGSACLHPLPCHILYAAGVPRGLGRKGCLLPTLECLDLVGH